ncbi:MAG: TlpA disulfide reductase family protein [Gammaproteobacteria bacterium]
MKSLFSIVILYVLVALSPLAALELPRGIIETPRVQAPAVRLEDMDGRVQALQEYRGQWVFVHFWASWCGPCRKEMPHIQRLIQIMEDQGLAFMIINTAESEDTVFTFLGGVAPELHSLLDRDGLVTEAWQPRGLPATYLVDPAGQVRYQALGGRPWHEKVYVDFLRALTDGN